MSPISMRVAALSALLLAPSSWAAIYTVYNKSGNNITLAFPGADRGKVIPLRPGESHEFNTWLEGVSHIRWTESITINPESFETAQGTQLGDYDADINLGALNIGARIEILSGGKFNYNFGIQGVGKNVQARKIG
jgi:hypothetical protein